MSKLPARVRVAFCAVLGMSGSIVLAGTASAHDWYVDANAASGGNGSSATPFQHISDGLSAAVDGDRILVAVATYNETLNVTKSVTILGDRAGGTTLDAGKKKTAVLIASGKTVWLQDLEVEHGQNTIGGGVSNSGTAILVRCRIVDCRAEDYGVNAYGGGIENAGTMVLWGCTVDSCTALSSFNPFTMKGGSAWGAGIDNVGTLKIFSSTISNNSISLDIYFPTGAGGGGISNSGTLRLVDSTVTGNVCSSTSSSGGGISSWVGNLLIDHSTIAFNFVYGHDYFGHGYAEGGGFDGVAQVSHSIFDENGGSSDQPWSIGDDFVGTCDSLGYVLIYDDEYTTYTGDLTGNQRNVSAILLPLADNGGLVQTHALDPTSPCINAGNPDPLASPAYDARGFPRALWDPSTGASDLGAYEYGSVPSYLLSATPGIPLPAGATLELVTGGGTFAMPLALAVVDFNGTPMFVPIVIATFDQSSVFELRTTVPSGLSGTTASLRSYSLDGGNKLIVSNRVTLTFQ